VAIDPRYQTVHERTVGKDRYEACMAKARKPGYWAPTRHYRPDGSFTIGTEYVEDKMSQECRNFYLWDTPACAGCEYPKDTDYRTRMA
jgi:hypothetical protein